ncbi:Transposase DDE domain protein [Planctomyces sp. SH-PL62]|nr:Transposase DDE domain protein [Planctomyces sp. SH-PL62]
MLIPGASWDRIRPLLPPPPKPKRPDRPGRRWIDARLCLTGILFVLKTGIGWEDLPREMGCGSGMTCRCRLAYLTAAGVWPRLHALLLSELEWSGVVDCRRATIDGSHVRARGGGEATGPSPVDRRKKGIKRVIVTDAAGLPLAAVTAPGKRPEFTQLERAVDAVPPVRGPRGRPRRRPDEMYADRGFDSKANRDALRRRGVRPMIARIRTPHSGGPGRRRWAAERTISWLHGLGRLRVRKDRSAARPSCHSVAPGYASQT